LKFSCSAARGSHPEGIGSTAAVPTARVRCLLLGIVRDVVAPPVRSSSVVAPSRPERVDLFSPFFTWIIVGPAAHVRPFRRHGPPPWPILEEGVSTWQLERALQASSLGLLCLNCVEVASPFVPAFQRPVHLATGPMSAGLLCVVRVFLRSLNPQPGFISHPQLHRARRPSTPVLCGWNPLSRSRVLVHERVWFFLF